MIFGAAALGRAQDEEAAPILELLLKYGINHIDTAAMYGRSERRVGTWMDNHRKDFFLATKTGERTYQKARDQFHHSLERMRVDSVDLLQLHNLVDPIEWETALGPGGALEAAVEAREQGLVLLHPFDDPAIVAGQAGAGREAIAPLGARAAAVDQVLVCVGGGGVVGGGRPGVQCPSPPPDIPAGGAPGPAPR